MKRRDFIKKTVGAAAIAAAPAVAVSNDYVDAPASDRVFIVDGQRYLVEQRLGVYRLLVDAPSPLSRPRLAAAHKVAADVLIELREAAQDEFMLGKVGDEVQWVMSLHMSREISTEIFSWVRMPAPATETTRVFGLRCLSHEPTAHYSDMVEFRFIPDSLRLTAQLSAMKRDFFN